MPQIQFTEEDWSRVERDTLAWWAGELERPLVYLAAVDPSVPKPPYEYMSNYSLKMPADQLVDCFAPFIYATKFYGDAFPWLWLNFGPGIVAGFLGAQVNSVAEPSETVWFTPKENKAIQDIHLAYNSENIWLKRVKDLTSTLVDRFGRMLAASMTDLGGNLDILASLRTSEGLLFDLMDRPDEVDRLAKAVTKLWLRYYDEIDAIIRPACRGTSCWTQLWSPGKTYMLQSDFSYMISPAMFERYVMPDLVACCEHLDHGFYHLDGRGEIPHLNMLLSIPSLRGIQWIPGDGAPPPQEWLPLLKRIRDGGKLCQVFVRPEGALKIVENLGGKGFLLIVQHEDNEFVQPEEAQAFLSQLARKDICRTNHGRK